jgi:FAD/FMN-containing dehydrogenase
MTAVRARVSSWGNLAASDCWLERPAFGDEAAVAVGRLNGTTGSVLARGLGRSYGDVCANSGGGVVATEWLDRCHFFDTETGALRADAGMTLQALHRITVPRGWLVPVTPGTKFITLGGAVANDVHGKNHHVAGSFGRHVRRLAVRRSDGAKIECAPDTESDLLRATIGGLGLTGLIEWVEINLQSIATSDIEYESVRFDRLDAFFDLSDDSAGWPYTVAWIDCLSRGATLGRGIFSRGRHAASGPLVAERPVRSLAVPMTPPVSLINPLSVRLFNETYYRRPGAQAKGRGHFDPFFYPLDAIRDWNRIYGRRGFYQYQCVIPPDRARVGVSRLLDRITAAGAASCLVVLKNFGDHPPAGLLSFPCAGTTLALDFPNQGKRTLDLLSSLDEVVTETGGRLYPAKDARMPGAMFHAGQPALAEFTRFVDPAFRSDFWRRVA